MPIHPWLADRLELIRDIPSFDIALRDPVHRANLAAFLQDPHDWVPPDGITADDRKVGSSDGAVPIRVFRPPTRSASPPPALLWMHGGAFVMGSIDDTESMIPGFELAARAGAVVVSVGYRLAVDGVRYPAPLDDTMTAWRWLSERTSELGIDPDRLFVGGASVGANLAAGVAVRLREGGEPLPRGMLLGYPLMHYPVPSPHPGVLAELDRLPALLRFPEPFQVDIVTNYAGRTTDLPADIVPGDHEVAGLPETWIALSEYDDLRGSGERFAEQLRDAGVPSHSIVAEGMVHGHLGRGPSLEPVAETLDFFASAMTDATSPR